MNQAFERAGARDFGAPLELGQHLRKAFNIG
jgi:hypothetical protein